MTQDQDIVEWAVADRYEQCMAAFEESGQRSISSTIEMWNALLEIHTNNLWVARFRTSGEWLAHVSELGYTGLSRSNIFHKLARMKMLVNGGVKQEIAAAAVVAVPGAVMSMGSTEQFQSALNGADPNEYVKEISFLPPGEAIKRVREDRGINVEMWFKEMRRGIIPGELVGLIVRSDPQRGYTAYDVKLTITPQIPGNADVILYVADWACNRIMLHQDQSGTR